MLPPERFYLDLEELGWGCSPEIL